MRPADVAEVLETLQEQLAQDLVSLHYERVPDLVERYGPSGRDKCLQDARHHLSYLAQAVASGQDELFVGYVAWGQSVLTERGIPVDDLVHNLRALLDVLMRELDAEAARTASRPVQAGLASLDVAEDLASVSFLSDDNPDVSLARAYLADLLGGRRKDACARVLAAVEQGMSVRDVYLNVFQVCQWEVGRLWQRTEISVAQEHFCTAATQLAMSQLYPYLFTGARSGRRMVATCVSGDLHELGVRMVADFFEMEGWDTHYLGANTPDDAVVSTLREQQPHLLAVSATITSHVAQVRSLVDAVRADEQLQGVRILVGGYPFNVAPDLWRSVGADGAATDADQALVLANAMVPA